MHLPDKPMKRPARSAPVPLAFIVSVLHRAVLVAIATALSTRFVKAHPARWLQTSAITFLLAFPGASLIAPVVRRLVERRTI